MTFPTHGKWTASTSEEAWDGLHEFDTRDEAIAFAISELGGTRVYVGQVHEITAEQMANAAVDAETVLERVDEWLYEQVGDECNNTLTHTKEQRDDLDRRLKAEVRIWMKANMIAAPCWRIDHVTSHVVPEPTK